MFKKYFNFGILSVTCVFGLYRVLIEEIPGHYRTFTQAALALWQHKQAYGVAFAGALVFVRTPVRMSNNEARLFAIK